MKKKAKDQSYIKFSNINMILSIILEKHPISRSEISALTGMSPTSITRIINSLLSLHLVREIDESCHIQNAVGRKAALLDIIPDSLYTVGIQVGIDNITVCILDLSSTVIAVITEDQRLDNLSLDDLSKLCLSIYQKTIMKNGINPLKILGLCVAFSALTDPSNGVLVLSSQFNWGNVNVQEKFQDIFCLPTTIENDEKACLIGEIQLRDLKDSNNLAVISFGAGVGCASTSDGFLVRGAQNGAGEIGHIIVDHHNGMKCNCGREGCLHTHISIPFLIKKAQEHDSSVMTITAFKEAYEARIPWALHIMEDCIEHIRLSLEIISAMYNPSKIIIFGALFHYFGQTLSNLILDSMSPPLIGGTDDRILFSTSNNKSCSIGCAHIARTTFINKLLEEKS